MPVGFLGLLHSLTGADKDNFFPEIFSLWFWEPLRKRTWETKCLSMALSCVMKVPHFLPLLHHHLCNKRN